MTKYYCDRCGQLCEYFKKGHRKYEIYRGGAVFPMDLCEECQKKLEDWMDNKTNTNNPAKKVKSPLLPIKKIFG